MEQQTKLCPYCAEEIKAAAIVCKHCGRNLTSNINLNDDTQQRRGVTVGDGVRGGCGMFIMLPLIIIIVLVILGTMIKSCNG